MGLLSRSLGARDNANIMIHHYKKGIVSLKTELNSLIKSPDRLEQLTSFQDQLVKRLRRIEARTRVLKHARGGNVRTFSADAPFDDPVRLCQFMHFVWRCFGDAVVFTYASKWDIKPLSFNVHDPSPRSSPGFITGKKGFAKELALSRLAAAHNQPSILCDLTNCIRYGDIAIFVPGIPPVLVECKGESVRNKRVRRQVAKLKEVANFLSHDIAYNMHGFPVVERHESSIQDMDHTDILNEMLEIASRDGESYREPESGVHYIVLRADHSGKLGFDLRPRGRLWIFHLNEYMNAEAWTSYRPFTLSIRNPQRLYDFLAGQLVVEIILDVAQVEQIANRYGFGTICHQEGNYPFEFSNDFYGTFFVSTQYITRVALDFASLSNLLTNVFTIWKNRVDNDGNRKGKQSGSDSEIRKQ